MKVAAAAYPVEALPDWDALANKLASWVASAGDADLLVFPEYAGLEAGLVGVRSALTAAQECSACAAAAPRYWQLLSDLARRANKVILAGSLPAASDNGLKNRAALLRPDGQGSFIDKIQLTPWERSETPLTRGGGAGVVQLDGLPPFGVLICYDGEFPLQARALWERGARLLLMPSATEAATGHARVRLAARARALESGSPVALAQIVGDCPVSAFADVSVGRAGIYGPPDAGWPPDGIVTQTPLNAPGWATAQPPQPTGPSEVSIAQDWDSQITAPESPCFHAIGQNSP